MTSVQPLQNDLHLTQNSPYFEAMKKSTDPEQLSNKRRWNDLRQAKIEQDLLGTPEAEVYSPAEIKAIESAIRLQQDLVKASKAKATLKSEKYPLTSAKLETLDGNPLAFVIVKGKLHTSAAKALAYKLDEFCFELSPDTNLTMANDKNDSKHRVTMLFQVAPPVVLTSQREFVNWQIWKKLDDGRWFFGLIPLSERPPSVPQRDNKIVQGELAISMILEDIGDNLCEYTYSMRVDVCLPIPAFILNGHLINEPLWLNKLAEYYFLNRDICTYKAECGETLAQIFLKGVDTTKGRSKKGAQRIQEHVDSICDKIVNLDSLLGQDKSFLQIFTKTLLKNKLTSPEPVDSAFADLTSKSIETISASLCFYISVRTNTKNAIDEWLVTYPAIIEYEEIFPWFYTLILTIATKINNNTGFLKVRRQSLAFGRSDAVFLENVDREAEINSSMSRSSILLGGNNFPTQSNRQLSSLSETEKMRKSGTPSLRHMQKYLGRHKGRRTFYILMAAGFFLNGALFCMPLGDAFAGVEANHFFLFVYMPMTFMLGVSILYGVCSVGFRVWEIAEDLSEKEASSLRLKMFTVTYLTICAPTFILVWIMAFGFDIFPIPFTIVFSVCCAAFQIPACYYIVKKSYADKITVTHREMKYLAITVLFVLPFVAIVPCSTGLYFATTGWDQFFVVAGLGALRMIELSGVEWIAYGRISELSVMMIQLAIDIFYEVHSQSLFSGADLTLTLALAPILDFTGNIATMIYIYYFTKQDKSAQTMMLIALSVREMVEVAVSLGVTMFMGLAWIFNKRSFYMLDVIEEDELVRAFQMSAIDFLAEVLVFIAFDQIVYTVWRVRMDDLAQAFAASIGYTEFSCIFASAIIIIPNFMMYHMGTDYFFNFNWIGGGQLYKNGTWCQELQDEGFSCYQK